VYSPEERPQQRREFIGQVAASAIVLAGAACASPAATAAQSSTAPTPMPAPRRPAPSSASAAPVHWDDSWFARLTAKHKAVFDSPQIEDGLVLANAVGYIRGMREAVAAGDSDVQAVIVIRHSAIPMAFNDAMWEKYQIGKDKKVKESRSDNWATHNPYLGGARGGVEQAGERPTPTFSWLNAHGHILLGCDLATRNYANVIARNFNADQSAVYEELKANLVPGMILQPTGVYAALRAQEAGCAYIRST
jgi:hypothetical protein